jgi:antitoxin component YwqK of YwqJK toxin-antitoxin module
MFQISAYYDGKLRHTSNYSNAVDAVHAFDKCVDYGFANEYATYNLLEPNGKMHTKHFYKNGEVSGK